MPKKYTVIADMTGEQQSIEMPTLHEMQAQDEKTYAVIQKLAPHITKALVSASMKVNYIQPTKANDHSCACLWCEFEYEGEVYRLTITH